MLSENGASEEKAKLHEEEGEKHANTLDDTGPIEVARARVRIRVRVRQDT